MPLLSTLLNVGAFCLPAGAGCILHSLPTTPDVSIWQARHTGTTADTAPSAVLVTANATALVYSSGVARPGEHFAGVFHSLIR